MVKILNKLTIFNVLITFLYNCAFSDSNNNINKDNIVEEKVIPLIEKWAPKVWLDPQEKFFPSDINYFLQEITPTMKNGQSITKGDISKIISTGQSSNDIYFVTNQNRDALLMDPNSFLHGVNPSKENVSIYAHVKTCDPEYNNFIVTYWFFYPFNEGKEMFQTLCKKSLPILKLFNKLTGKKIVIGNHVGDWERVSIEFKNRIPSSLFLSVHDVGVIYSYDEAANTFVLSKAKSKGLGEAQDPPETVRVDELGHPVLFSAKGSHALWAGVGSHRYTKLNLQALSDVTDLGTPWETWRSVKVFYSQETTPDWYNFQGHWGNPEAKCFMKGICEFKDGPQGLVNRQPDFKCMPKSSPNKDKRLCRICKYFKSNKS